MNNKPITTITTTRAFTLIELLIVVAIIAVISASSLAVLTGPMYERVRAEDQQAFETGSGLFFATVIADAHRAASLEVSPTDSSATTQTLTFQIADATTSTVRYTVNSAGILSRSVDGKLTANLAPGIQVLTAEKQSTASLWTVTLAGKIRGFDAGVQTTTTRQLDVLVGPNSWTGGGQS